MAFSSSSDGLQFVSQLFVGSAIKDVITTTSSSNTTTGSSITTTGSTTTVVDMEIRSHV